MPQQEDPLSTVRCADVGRSEHKPLRIEPEAGQRPENVAESCAAIDAEEAPDVFEKEPLGLALAQDAFDNGPEPSIVGAPKPLTGDTVALAGHSGDNKVASSAKRARIEGCQVRPNRRRSHGAFFHARRQDSAGVCFPLHVSEVEHVSAQPSGGSRDAEIEAASAGTEGQSPEGR